MNIGIVGNGNIGKILGDILIKKNHKVEFGVRNLENLEKVASFSYVLAEDITKNNEIIILAIPGDQLENILPKIKNVKGKIFIDLTNPIGEGLKLFRGTTTSNGEVAQELLKDAFVVKTLNTVGHEKMVDTSVNGERLTMMIAGDYKEANEDVATLLKEMGYEPLIVGELYFSRYLEPTAMIWIDMARKQQRGSNNGIKWLIGH